jgi:hypothetical protein
MFTGKHTFELGLLATRKDAVITPQLVLPAIQEAVSAIALTLKEKGLSPYLAHAELALLRQIVDRVEPKTPELQRALGRLCLEEAKIFRALGRTEWIKAADRIEYFERAVKLVDDFVSTSELSPGDRINLKRENAVYRLDYCDFLKTRVNRRLDRSTCEDPQHAHDYYNLRKLVFSVLQTLRDEENSATRYQNGQTAQVRERAGKFCIRSMLTCPTKTALSRELAIKQNFDLLQSGIYKDLLALRSALSQSHSIYGASTALASNYIGYNEQLGMFLSFPVVSYLQEKLSEVGEVVGVSIPYTQGGQKVVDDFDVVFKITKKSNPFGLNPGLYFGEIKATLGTIPFDTNTRAQREMHEQLRCHERERQRLVGCGLPAKSQLVLIEFYPDETRYQHQNNRLPIGMSHITIRAPLKGAVGIATPPVIDKNGVQALIDEDVSTEGLIQRLH